MGQGVTEVDERDYESDMNRFWLFHSSRSLTCCRINSILKADETRQDVRITNKMLNRIWMVG